MGGVGDVVLDVGAEAAEIGGHGGEAKGGAFHGGVTPGFVVAGEDAHVAAADELLVVQVQQRAGGSDELGVKDDLYGVVLRVEQIPMTEMLENGVLGVVDEIVSNDRWLWAGAPS